MLAKRRTQEQERGRTGTRLFGRRLPRYGMAMTDLSVTCALLLAFTVARGRIDPATATFGATMLALLLFLERDERLVARALDGAGTLAKATGISYIGASIVGIYAEGEDPEALLALSGTLVFALLAARTTFSRTVRGLVSRSASRPRVMIVGEGEVARRLIRDLKARDHGVELVGVADDSRRQHGPGFRVERLGRIEDVPDLIDSHNVSGIIVAFGNGRHNALVQVIRGAVQRDATVWMIPRLFELGWRGCKEHISNIPLVRLETPPRLRPQWILKRTVDFVVAGACLLLTFPMMATIAIAVRLDLGRPVLLRQQRVSLDGRIFDILKFRTMETNELAEKGMEWAPDEDRITRVGRFLRATNADELPQLFNVLKGEMSLVGPRPERVYFVNLLKARFPQYSSRHRLPAGVTGWAQVNGLRGDTSVEERIAFDNHYIENWSLGGDFKILARTASLIARSVVSSFRPMTVTDMISNDNVHHQKPSSAQDLNGRSPQPQVTIDLRDGSSGLNITIDLTDDSTSSKGMSVRPRSPVPSSALRE